MTTDHDDEDRFSVCAACATHPQLAAFIEANSTPDRQCSLCQENAYPCCSIEDTLDLENVFKALIRIHYNEEEYNHHWGGHYSPTTLLAMSNEIIDVERMKPAQTNAEQGLELLDHELSALPYPNIDKGIGIYAGYTDGQQNMLLRAIRDWDAWSLTSLKRSLQTKSASGIGKFRHSTTLLRRPNCGRKVYVTEPSGS